MIGLGGLILSCMMWQQPARAAEPDVAALPATSAVVLPLQINAAAGQEQLKDELPELIRQRLEAKGITVLSNAQTNNLISGAGVRDLDVNAVRSLARTSRSDFALYGSFTQTGDAFSLDLRMVDPNGDRPARPYFAQETGMINLLSAVDRLVTAVVRDAPVKGGIADIRVEGLRVLDQDMVLMRLNMRKGDHLNPPDLNNEVRRILDLGYFSDVQVDIAPEGAGVAVIFKVVEKPRIDDVIVNGSDAVSKEDILAAMSSKTGSVLNDRFLAGDVQKVTDLYRKEGYYLAKVDARVEERARGGSAVLVFDVDEGKKLYIKAVRIEGLSDLDADEIKKTLALSERSIISWFTGTGVLREEHLERDSQAVTAFCLNKGYVDAQVAAPEVVYEDDGIVILFRVNEGRRYTLGRVGFEGDLLDTEENMMSIIAMDEHKQDDGYFSLLVMQDDIKKLTDYYSDYGYAFAEVDVQTPQDSDAGTVDVIYSINRKNAIFVRRVEVEGNTRTRDNVILREMRLTDGDPFDGSKLRRSNERLSRLRFFSKSDIIVQPTEEPDEVDLKVSVEDDRTGVLSGGVGYSTYYEFGISASVMERNLFGRGYQLGLTGFLSGRSTSLDLQFTNPRLWDTNLGFTNSTYAVWTEWDDFSKRTVGNTISLFYPIGEYTTIGGGYRLDFYRLSDIPYYAPRSYTDYLGNNMSSVVHGRIVFDNTDSREQPTRGYMARLFAEYGGGGLGGDDNFFRPVGELQGFHSLTNSGEHVFHWRGRMGGVFENSSKSVPIFDRFFIGGIDSIRGYSQRDLSPRDRATGDEIGADRIGFVNLEYIWTFYPDLGMAIVPFYDVGYSIDSKYNSMFEELKQSVGLELRWRSPMGDLRFAYGYPLSDNVRGERRKSGRFEFSMGQFF
jgi:outer membrane protein insertion porin family